jgi:hypothetical protein
VRCVAFSRFFSVPNGSSYILTCFLSCHLDRGTSGNAPISYKELTTLHFNCVRALAMSSFNPPAKHIALDTGTYTKYCRFQVQWPDRIKHLKTAGQQFEIPEKDDADKYMPPMLFKFDAKVKADDPQPLHLKIMKMENLAHSIQLALQRMNRRVVRLKTMC